MLKLQARHLTDASPEELKEWLKATGFDVEAYSDILIGEKGILFLAAGSSADPFCLALSRLLGGCSAVLMTPNFLGTQPFDFAIVPEHDHPAPADNIFITLGAPNHIYVPDLKAEAEKLFAPIEPLPKKVIALLLGGSDANYELTPVWVQTILPALRDAAEKEGAALLVTTSRRTGKEADIAVESVLASSPSTRYLLLASQSADNPVLAMLGAATHVLVTEDSVSMVSEAVTAGFRVGLLRVGRKQNPLAKSRNLLGGGVVRFDEMLEKMLAKGLVEDLGTTPNFNAFFSTDSCKTNAPFNEAKMAAEWILNRWNQNKEKAIV
jgi:hypothetical protein